MVEIRVPVERLREVSKSLEIQRQEADTLLQSALSLVDGLYGEWTGLAQVDYAQMFNDQVPPIRVRFNEILERLASELHRIADVFEEADDLAVDGISPSVIAGFVGGAAVGGAAAGSSGSSGGGTKLPGEASLPEQPAPPSVDSYQPRYDGATPAPGMNSTYGKPGQVPLDAPVKSNPGDRSAGLYGDAINQFGAGNNPRYTSDNHTYCNTFAGDVARAMGVPLPTKAEYGMNPVDRATVGFPQMWDYFTNPNAPVKAADQGWRAVGQNDLATLQNHVNGGKMAVVVNNGHIAVIRPGQTISDFGSIRIAQAGARCGNDMSLAEGFGNSATPQIFIID